MAPPAKRQKLSNNSKSSPAKPRGLDYYFGKQKRDLAVGSSGDQQEALPNDPTTELTDEQLARRLQAQWDEELAGPSSVPVSKEDKPDSLREGLMDRDQAVLPAYAGNEAQDQIDIKGEDDNLTSKEIHFSQSETRGTNGLAPSVKNTLSLQSGGPEEDTISHTIPFDESTLTFDPAKYVPDLQKHWAELGGNASYALLTRCFVLVNSTQSRIKIVDTLVNLLRTIIEGDPSSLLPTVCISMRHNILAHCPF